MKRVLLLTLLLPLLLFSCNNDENGSSASSVIVKMTKSADSHSESQEVLFSGSDIKSFNVQTGEIVFKKSKVSKAVKNNLNKSFVFYSDENILFTSFSFQTTNDLMSHIINDLVLYYDLKNDKFYLRDGYPSVEVLGYAEENARKTREENKDLRAPAWELFLLKLKDSGKLQE